MTKEEREDAINFFKAVAEREVNNAKYSKLAIEALEQKHWIPVSERLPKKVDEYLVTMLDYVSHEPYVGIVTWSNIDIGNNGFWACHKVVAWSEVPEPYKEE